MDPIDILLYHLFLHVSVHTGLENVYNIIPEGVSLSADLGSRRGLAATATLRWVTVNARNTRRRNVESVDPPPHPPRT